ncbi:hypothetical protein C4578_04275 [Candidatus Microgenomates bacterium]|jgi:hypothetical protein|nr:MAG: hypothetical protein C4578_04275 [Candidatus Microgenomates bacterium]
MAERINPGVYFKIEGYLEEENKRLAREYPIIIGLRDLETSEGQNVLSRVTGSFLTESSLMVVSGVPFAGKSSVLKEFREFTRREIDPFLDFSREWSYEDALYAEVAAREIKLQDIDYHDKNAVRDLLAPVNQHLFSALVEELHEASRENRENRNKMAAWKVRKNYPLPEERIQIVTSEIPGVGPSWVDMGRTALHKLAEQDRKATVIILVPDLQILSKTMAIRSSVIGAPASEVIRILKDKGIELSGFDEELSEAKIGRIIQQIMYQSAGEEFGSFIQKEMIDDYSYNPLGVAKENERMKLLNELKLPGFLDLTKMDSLRFKVNYHKALELKESLEGVDRQKHGEKIHKIVLAFNPWAPRVYFRPPNNHPDF